ncbi:alpha/beta hydrolase [Actinokineospora iranica]|nr:alpha/beta fold hydrolase [Actinokineospora iranica]
MSLLRDGGFIARSRVRAVAAAGLAAVALAAAAATPAGAAPPVDAPNSGFGITVTGWRQVGAEPATDVRLYEVALTTEAIYRPGVNPAQGVVPIRTRILLPANYGLDPARRHDVLYLLHGGGGGTDDWAKQTGGDAMDIVRASSFDGIVVMPEGGYTGWYSDWHGFTDGRFRPDWETFHIEQLIPWVDANFTTDASRAGRGIAGVSMGGFGALKYAGRHSDLFSVVGSFSGGTNINDGWAQDIIANSGWQTGAAIRGVNLLDGTTRVNLYRPSGVIEPDQDLQRAYRLRAILGPTTDWPLFNPLDLAATELFDPYDGKFALYSGGNAATPGGAPSGELDMGTSNNTFHATLNAHGVTHRYCTGPGTHTWDFFRNDFRDFLEYAYGTPPANCTANTGWSSRPTVP